MSNAILYGLIIAAVSSLYTLVLYFLGYQTDNIATGMNLGYIALLFPIVGIILGMRDAKSDALEDEKPFRYGKSLLQGLFISLFWGLGTALFVYVYYTFINPEFVDYLVDFQKDKMNAQGNIPEATMEAMEKGMRFMSQPWIAALLAPFQCLFSGLIVSLIAAIFIRTKGEVTFDELEAEAGEE